MPVADLGAWSIALEFAHQIARASDCEHRRVAVLTRGHDFEKTGTDDDDLGTDIAFEEECITGLISLHPTESLHRGPSVRVQLREPASLH